MPILRNNKATKLTGVKTDGSRLKPIVTRTPPTPQLKKHENKPLKLTIQRKSELEPSTISVKDPKMSKSMFDLDLEESDSEDLISSTNPIVLSQNEPTGLPTFSKDEKRPRSRSASINSVESDAVKQSTTKVDPIKSTKQEETTMVDKSKATPIDRGSGQVNERAVVESEIISTRRKISSQTKKRRLDQYKQSISKATPLVINSDSEVEEVEKVKNGESTVVGDFEGDIEKSNLLKGKRRAATEQKKTENVRTVVEEDELGATAQKDFDFPLELSSSQRSRRGQKTFGGKSQKRDLDRRKKERDEAEQMLKSSQPDYSEFVDINQKLGILKKVDDIEQRQKEEKVQKIEEWRSEFEKKAFINGRDMLSTCTKDTKKIPYLPLQDVAQTINIDLPDDLLAEITSSQTRDSDSLQDSSQKDHKCPICQHSVSSNLYNSYGTQALKKFHNQQKLHVSHEKEWAFTQKSILCIPDIDWDIFEQRCRSHFDFLAKLMKGNTDETSHYRREYTRLHTKKRGKDKTKKDFASGNWDQTVPGYYGPYGSMRMSDLIMQSSLIKHSFTGEVDQCPISAGEYSVSILVPELGIQLIMEDMKFSNYHQGLKFMIDTIKIGQILNSVAAYEDDSDGHDHNFSDDDDNDNYYGGDGNDRAKGADLLSVPDDEDDGKLDWKRPIEIHDDDGSEIPDDFECDEWIHGVDETMLIGDDEDDNHYGAESQYVG